MQNILTNENIKKAIQYLLYTTTITPAIVLASFLFPYISVRTIFFRLLIELVLILFLILIFKNKINLAKSKNFFLYVFGLFVIANIISSFFSFSFVIAWFSDIERMWGVFTLLHLFLFYFFIRSFFKGKEWRIFLNISIAVSLYVSLYGIFQYYPEVFSIDVLNSGKGRIISTLGNPAYVAIYMLFNIFFALFLLTRNKNIYAKLYYGAVILINFFAFSLTDTRGTSLGLLAGVGISALLYILLGKSKKGKIGVAALIIIGSLIMFWAFLNPENRVVQSNSFMRRMATIGLHGSTIETRKIGWNAAWQGFKESPIVGVGMDNYNVVFNKYFNSDYYLYAPTEPYFDRSHNAFLDVLVMNGVVGFVIFLSLLYFIFYYLIKGYKKGVIKLDEFLIFLSLSIAYLTHLFFVFDDLNSYIYFVALIGFIEYRFYKNEIIEIHTEQPQKNTAIKIGAGIIVVIIALSAYSFNIKVWQACGKVIEAYNHSKNYTAKTFEIFNEALAYDIVPSRNIIMTYVNYIGQQGNNYTEISKDPGKLAILKSAVLEGIEALDKEIKKDSHNALLYDRKAMLNNTAFIIFQDLKYFESAVKASQNAIELSPEHLQYYHTLSDSYILASQPDKSIEIISKSIEINRAYKASYFFLAKAYVANGELDKALDTAEIFTELEYRPSKNSFYMFLADKFNEQEDFAKAAEIMELALIAKEDDTEVLVKLVQLYLLTAQNDKAIAIAEKLGKVDAIYNKDVSYIIQQIKEGKTEELLEKLGAGK